MARTLAVVRLAVILALALCLTGCTGGGSSPAPTAGSSVAPTPASPPPSAPPATPEATAASLAEPPEVSMATEGGDPVAGSLGSFTWGDGGSDSPWLPGGPIASGIGEQLSVVVAGAVPVRDWVAKRIEAGVADGSGAVAIASGGAAPITFTAPPPGDWSVQVVVTFGDELGAATYYWHLTVS